MLLYNLHWPFALTTVMQLVLCLFKKTRSKFDHVGFYFFISFCYESLAYQKTIKHTTVKHRDSLTFTFVWMIFIIVYKVVKISSFWL